MEFLSKIISFFKCCNSECVIHDNYDYVIKNLKNLGYEIDPSHSKNCQKRQLVEIDELYLFKNRSIFNKTLVIELNYTLLYASYTKIPDPDYVYDYFVREEPMKIYVKERPFLREFLELISTRYEIIIYTTASINLAEFLTKRFDIYNRISYVLGGDWCGYYDKRIVKNITLIPRNFIDIVVMDFKISNYFYSPKYKIIVSPYFGDPEDRALLDIMKVLYKRKYR